MTLYIAASLVLSCISGFLVWHHEYEDGIFGRIFLGVLALTNALIVFEWLIDRPGYQLLPQTIVNQIAMAGFIARHCYRFLRWRWCGHYQWRPARK